jgi:hypothetical protein
MNTNIPMNELDKAIAAMVRSRAAFPDFCRAVVQGDLCFLRNYHVGIQDEPLVIKKGEIFPLALLEDADGKFTPLFSSEARAEEGMRAGNVPMLTYLPGTMPAKQLLGLLGVTSFGAIINKGCVTGEIAIRAELIRDLASGKVLQPTENGPHPSMTGTVRPLDPADYPTELVQGAFEFMRKHKNFRAAWIWLLDVAGRPGYTTGVLMDPPDAGLFHDFNLAVHAGLSRDYGSYIVVLDEKRRAEFAQVLKQSLPFYTAPDYLPPPSVKV